MFGLPSHFGPGTAESVGRRCQTCEHWSGMINAVGAAVCWKNYPQQTVMTYPERGCSFWLRAIGSDDDLGSPPRTVAMEAFRPEDDDSNW